MNNIIKENWEIIEQKLIKNMYEDGEFPLSLADEIKSILEKQIKLNEIGFTGEVIENYKIFEDECITKGFTFKSLLDARDKQINGGWIPCSERLPENLNDKNIDCFLVTDGFLIWMAYYNSEIGWQFAECTNSRNKIDWTEIIAWRPLPTPYQESEVL